MGSGQKVCKTTAETIHGGYHSEAASKSKFFVVIVLMNGLSNNDLKAALRRKYILTLSPSPVFRITVKPMFFSLITKLYLWSKIL